MSKFGLEPEQHEAGAEDRDFVERLNSFPPAAPRPRLDLAAVDAAALPHGFVSRENSFSTPASPSRRRRLGVPEPTRHLAIRLTVLQYNRFVAYADEHQLTYQDTLDKLLRDAGH